MEPYVVKTYENEKWRLKIIEDFDPISPREDDNFGTMVCFHPSYNLGDKHDFQSPKDFQEWWKEEGKGGIVLSLFLYDHSGIAMNTDGFSCPWDSGQVGWIYIAAEKIREEFRIEKITKAVRQKVKENLVAEAKGYNQFLEGDMWGFEIEQMPDEEFEDSCWGFYGSDPQENGMWDHFSEEIRQLVDPNYEVNPDGYFLDNQLELKMEG